MSKNVVLLARNIYLERERQLLEASTGFLNVYNPTALVIRQKLPWLPIPVFTFSVWLAILIAANALLLGLTPFVVRGQR